MRRTVKGKTYSAVVKCKQTVLASRGGTAGEERALKGSGSLPGTLRPTGPLKEEKLCTHEPGFLLRLILRCNVHNQNVFADRPPSALGAVWMPSEPVQVQGTQRAF